MGKYDAVLPNLKRFAPEDLTYQAKVDQVKDKITKRDPYSLASQYEVLRAQKEAMSLELSVVNLMIEAYEQLMAASQEAQEDGWGLYGAKPNAIRLKSGAKIRIQLEPAGKVVNREDFRLWCVGNGYERQLMLWPSTTQAIVKERLLAGEEPPDGIEVGSYAKIFFDKAPEGAE